MLAVTLRSASPAGHCPTIITLGLMYSPATLCIVSSLGVTCSSVVTQRMLQSVFSEPFLSGDQIYSALQRNKIGAEFVMWFSTYRRTRAAGVAACP